MSAFRMPRRTMTDIERESYRVADDAVAAIVDRVRREGDAALRDYARAFGDPEPREIGRAEMDEAIATLPGDLRGVLERTRGRIARFAEKQRAALQPFTYVSEGFVLGQQLVPLASAGAYVPAGRYPLPSTALMTIVTARIAGVANVVACTPRADPVILAACAIAGVDRLFLCGGAQAIAAMAYGTALVPRVAKVVGPGNAYVAGAKRLVAGVCGIDTIAGPSEVAVIASRDARPDAIARSLLAEAEHDPQARAYLLCDDEYLAVEVDAAIDVQLAALDTADVARAALLGSATIVCETLEACAQAANVLAAEHVELLGAGAERVASQLRNYGELLIGAPAAFGDYGAGPNHTLPTGGSARFSSGLSVYDFTLVRPCIRALEPARTLVGDAVALAEAERLPAHAAALSGSDSPSGVASQPERASWFTSDHLMRRSHEG